MLTFLALGALGFWFVVVLLWIAVAILVENEKGIWATLVIAASVWSASALYHLSIWAFVKANPIYLAKIVGVYVLVGLAWSFVKWYFHLHKRKVAYRELKHLFMQEMGAKEWTSALAYRFESVVDRHSEAKIPEVSDHKVDLTFWAAYWPFSFVGTMLNDVIRKIWDYLYEVFHGVYQKMADYVMREARQDLALSNAYRDEQKKQKTRKED